MRCDPAHCGRCRAARRGDHASQFTPFEWAALGRTGLDGEIRGIPVVRALLLPRKGIVQFAGMSRPGLVEWETPAFRCPWSILELPPVLRHGPTYRTLDGTPVRNAEYVDNFQLDENGCFHRTSHCQGLAGDEGYFVRPFTDPTLPRRLVELW